MLHSPSCWPGWLAGLSELRNALSFDPTQMVRADDEADILAAAAALDAVSGTMDNKGDVESGYNGAAAPFRWRQQRGWRGRRKHVQGLRPSRLWTDDRGQPQTIWSQRPVTGHGRRLSVGIFILGPKVEQVLGRVQRNVRDFSSLRRRVRHRRGLQRHHLSLASRGPLGFVQRLHVLVQCLQGRSESRLATPFSRRRRRPLCLLLLRSSSSSFAVCSRTSCTYFSTER